jgi:hypothetical protein
MTLRRALVALAVLPLLAASVAAQQDFQPPPAQKVDADTRKQIQQKLDKLGDAIAGLRKKGVEDPLLVEVEVFYQAGHWMLTHNEFFQKESVAWTLEALDRGLARARMAEKDDFTWLKTAGQTTIRAYRSLVDNSVQPYAVTLPADYGEEAGKKYRLDIVLHGRDKSLNEVKFLHQHGDKKAPKDLEYVRIDIYGRGNNAYRWAGELDVLEARAAFELYEELLGRGKLLDKRRHVLRGFSMGGAGAWHLGLHHCDQWCVVGPGAGFSATHGYIKNLPQDLGWPQEQLLTIYDAALYAENIFNVPVVAYAGSKDPQLQAAKNIEARVKASGLELPLTILVAPDLEHSFPPAWQQKAEEAYAPFIEKGRAEYPKRVRFVTHTLKYPDSDWVDILALTKHYERTLVDAEKTADGFKVTTANVDALRLQVPKGQRDDMTVVIDKQEVEARPWGNKGSDYSVYLVKQNGKWKATLPQRIAADNAKKPRKVAGLTGPIDDAFTASFLCVRGTGKPWSERTQEYAEASLERFRKEWAKYMRGELPVKDDSDVTAEDIADKNLILFGDPGSNTMIANVLPDLPLTWTKDKVALGGKTFDSTGHVPVLIYPNALGPGKYVVLNSGHTFHSADFEGTNALLYPRLGDYAVLRLAAKGPALGNEQVVLNGLFDEEWQLYAGK